VVVGVVAAEAGGRWRWRWWCCRCEFEFTALGVLDLLIFAVFDDIWAAVCRCVDGQQATPHTKQPLLDPRHFLPRPTTTAATTTNMRASLFSLFFAGAALALPKITRTGKYLYDESGNRFFIKVFIPLSAPPTRAHISHA
jgi:hypothetical protein